MVKTCGMPYAFFLMATSAVLTAVEGFIIMHHQNMLDKKNHGTTQPIYVNLAILVLASTGSLYAMLLTLDTFKTRACVVLSMLVYLGEAWHIVVPSVDLLGA